MRKFLAVLTAVALLGCAVAVPSALALTKGQAQRAVSKRVKARYVANGPIVVECHRLTSTRFGCAYSYNSLNESFCEGGATVRQFTYGIAVKLGKPRAVIDNGGC